MPFERDEGEYAYSAWLLNTGKGLPYKDTFLQKPPLVVYTYMVGQMIDPFSVWTPRLISAIFLLLTSVFIFFIAKKEWGLYAGLFSSFLFISLINFPPIAPFTANTERFLILPLIVIVFLFVNFKNSQKIWPYLALGILSSIVVFYKPISLPVVIFINLYWFFFLYKENKNLKSVLKKIFFVFMSFVGTSVIIMLPFFSVLPYFIEEVFVFNFSYISVFGYPFENFLNHLSKFFNYWWILLFFIFGFFIKKPNNLNFYLYLLIISLCTIFSTPIGHYYIMVIPFLALIFGALYNSFIYKLDINQKTVATILSLIFVLYIILYPFKEQFSFSPKDLSKWVYGTVNPFVESKEISDQLEKITKPEDIIFVAGSEPQIYFYSKRKSNTRFIITYPLNLPTSYREKYQNELVDIFSKDLPKAIVLSNRIHSGLWNQGSPEIFIKYLDNLLSKDYTVFGGYVWDKGGEFGRWENRIDSNNLENTSLIIYLKND
jgi:hypothetical protein